MKRSERLSSPRPRFLCVSDLREPRAPKSTPIIPAPSHGKRRWRSRGPPRPVLAGRRALGRATIRPETSETTRFRGHFRFPRQPTAGNRRRSGLSKTRARDRPAHQVACRTSRAAAPTPGPVAPAWSAWPPSPPAGRVLAQLPQPLRPVGLRCNPNLILGAAAPGGMVRRPHALRPATGPPLSPYTCASSSPPVHASSGYFVATVSIAARLCR